MTERPILNGIINLHKPLGLTSRQAVDKIKHRVKPNKIGHAGTLDPLATGVLVVCVGAATRLIEFVQQMPKRYVGTFLFGRSSPTEDLEGEITELVSPPIPTREQIAAACTSFIGEIQQRPPAFSAIWVRGQRSYALARKGRDIEHIARPVQIHSLNVVEYQYPELILDVECGSGTYIRSLGRDLSESLGTAAVMSALERTAIGPFNIDTACDPRDLPAEKISAVLQPPESALTDIPQITLSNVEIEDIARGRYIVAPTIAEVRGYACEGLELFTALDERGTMVALMRRRSETKLGPYISFVAIS